ncbi:MAG: Planctomycete cytochrome [Planctomycetaceae bacterium]|nr:Planctomycete cytochrome [Planctomycetaceae bacterium]
MIRPTAGKSTLSKLLDLIPIGARQAALCAILLACSGSAACADDGLEFFEKKIRPVLVERCYKCHSSESAKPKGGLRLDRRTSVFEGGDSGPALQPGKADESLLMQAIAWSGSVSEMPPDSKLPERVIADFREWITRGAAFPADSGPVIEKPRPVDIEQGRGFWSFQPVQVRLPGTVSDPTWPRRKLDSFVLSQLDAKGMRHAPEADRRTLVRRLSLNLLGVPPTYAETEAFVVDTAPDSYERLVDRYLASPQYGERWGRHWLDIARYAEDHPTSESTCKAPRFPYRYRDWVISALNDDLPYDDFVRRQLAADLLDVPPSEIAALGFLGLSPVYHKEPKLSAEVISVIVADEWDERLDTVTRGFLGLTVACARCHDHKFDPLKTEDYYALAGVIASTQLVEWPLISTAPEVAAALTEVQRQIVDVELRFDYAKKNRKTAQGDWLDLTTFDEEVRHWEDALQKLKSTPLFEGPIANGIRDAGLWLNGDDPAWTLLDYQPGRPRDLPVFIRGNPANPGKAVPRRFLEVLTPPAGRPFSQGSGRRELAEAIVQDAAPLTARVIVNRVWGWHFDRPLVTTPSNFGRLGDAPSHPELLDDLAARFIAAGWSLKWLHREIVNSATWRQSTHSLENYHDRDPDNRLLWRMNRRRLEAEAWRDTVLATSAELDPTMQGPSVNLDEAQARRRTVYGIVSRQKPADLFRLFDFPDAKRHAENRLPTTTPLQHLYLLNSPFLEQQSDAVVRTALREKPESAAETASNLFRRILLRDPTGEELSAALGLVQLENGTVPAQNWPILAHSLLATNEFMYVD